MKHRIHFYAGEVNDVLYQFSVERLCQHLICSTCVEGMYNAVNQEEYNELQTEFNYLNLRFELINPLIVYEAFILGSIFFVTLPIIYCLFEKNT